MIQDAVVRNLEVVGEATKRLSNSGYTLEHSIYYSEFLTVIYIFNFLNFSINTTLRSLLTITTSRTKPYVSKLL